jgi:hypothetical protein
MDESKATRREYHQLSGLAEFYFEDSYVLGINTFPETVEIILSAVLTERHPLYSAPLPNELYCYRRIRIVFPEAETISWLEKSYVPYTDATGEVDFGNIDEFYELAGHYLLLGDWGKLDIVSSEPVAEILEQES